MVAETVQDKTPVMFFTAKIQICHIQNRNSTSSLIKELDDIIRPYTMRLGAQKESNNHECLQQNAVRSLLSSDIHTSIKSFNSLQ